MNLTRREMAAAVAAGGLAAGLAAGLAVAILLDSWHWSIGLVGALVVVLSALILIALLRQDSMRITDFERIERKVDNLALRIVTESQATQRELGGLIEELGSTLQASETPRT
jgi:predicted lipid-binding transport protein (Tim44 family)